MWVVVLNAGVFGELEAYVRRNPVSKYTAAICKRSLAKWGVSR